MKFLLVALLSVAAMKLHGQDIKSADSTNIHKVAEPMAEFPGGMEALVRFLQKNMILPSEARQVQGKVFIGFVVNEDGSLSDFKVVKGLSETIDKSVLETFMKMPNWIPARKDNKSIKTKMIMPYYIHSL